MITTAENKDGNELREEPGMTDDKEAQTQAQAAETGQPKEREYLVLDKSTDPTASPEDYGYYRASTGERLTNFTAPIRAEEQIEDGGKINKTFTFGLNCGDIETSFSMGAGEFEKQQLPAAIRKAGGIRCRTFCSPKEVKESILDHASTLEYDKRRITRDFGWARTGDVYRFPSGSIDKNGYRPVGDDEWRVELAGSNLGRRLDLKQPPAAIQILKRVVWDNLVGAHDIEVTLPLLGAAGIAVLHPFAAGFGRFALWLVGPSGVGKSYLSALFMSLFGDFSPAQGAMPTWNSTSGFLQQEGYNFRDAIFCIDDFKEHNINPIDVVRVVQNYADGTGRGRLKGGGGGASETRPIRGMLVSTAEGVPDWAVSTLARLVIVSVREVGNLERGRACLDNLQFFPGVMAAFIHHILATGRARTFEQRVLKLQGELLAKVDSAPNAARIAGNLAGLGVSILEWVEFLASAVPEAVDVAGRYVQEHLPILRDEHLRLVREQSPEQLYLSCLMELIRNNEVHILDFNQAGGPVVGKLKKEGVLAVAIPWSIDAANKVLVRRGKPVYEPRHLDLLAKHRDAGVLCDDDGVPIPAGATVVEKVVSVQGKAARSFLIRTDVVARM